MPRVVIAFAVAVALVTPAFAADAHASPGSDLSTEQQKAAQIEAQIESNGNRVSVLDEQYLQTQQAIQHATDQIAADEATLGAKTHEAAALRARLALRAAEIYMGAGTATPLSALDAKDANELGTRSTYAGAAADQDTHLLDEVKVATQELGLQQRALEKARAAALAQRDQLARSRDEINQATAQQETLLSQVKGRIKQLIAADEAAKQRAADAAARAEAAAAAARAAQLARDAQSSTTGNSSGNSSAGSTAGSTSGSNSGGGAVSPGVPAPNSQAQVAVNTAEAQLGKPYVYAGSGPNVFDCSGLTMYAWAAAGVSLPHSAAAQYEMLPHLSLDAVQPGDLVFFGNPIHHVGMVVGGGMMIEAPFTGADVRYHSMYRPDFAGAARP